MGVFVICGLGGKNVAKRHVKSQINTMKEEDSSSSTDEEETEDEDLTGRHLAHRDNPNVDVRKTLTSLHKKVKRQWKTLGHRLPNHSCCENCDGKFLTIRESASLSTTGKRRLDDAPMLCASKDCSNWTHFACRYGIMRDNTMRSGLPMHKDVNYKHFCRECEKKVPSFFRIKEDDPLNYCDICLMCIPATQHIVHHRNNHTKSKKKEGGQERTFPHGSLWVYRSGFTEYKEKQSCACIVCHKFHFLDRDGEKVSVRKCDGTCGRYGHKKCILESSTRGQVAVNETGEWTWLCSLCADKQTESRIRLEQLLTTQQSSAPMSDPQSLAARSQEDEFERRHKKARFTAVVRRTIRTHTALISKNAYGQFIHGQHFQDVESLRAELSHARAAKLFYQKLQEQSEIAFRDMQKTLAAHEAQLTANQIEIAALKSKIRRIVRLM